MTRARDIADRNVDSTTIDGVDSTQLLRSDAADTKTAGDLTFSNGVKGIFGSASEMSVFHDGSNSFINNNGTGAGALSLKSDDINLMSSASETMATFVENGAVTLFYDNSAKVSTTASGISVTGDGFFTNELQCYYIRGQNDTNTGITWNGSDVLSFTTGGSERMRLSGTNLSVGTTTTDIYDSTSETGSVISDGYLAVARASTVAYLNRLSSDGDIVEFRKGGASAGRIGTVSGDLYIANAVDVGLYLDSTGTDHIAPCDASGSKRDNAIDLGASSARFQNGWFGNVLYSHYLRGQNDTDTGINVGNTGTANTITFITGNAEKARFISNSTPHFLVGCTSEPSSSVAGTAISTTDAGSFQSFSGTTNTSTHAAFGNTNGVLGTIRTTASATQYNTSSDRRLKSNIQDAASASSKIDAIQVRQFDWNADSSHQDYGLIAQELQPIAPIAVTGSADSDEMMGVDYSKLVPMLLKEVQSLRSRVATLEAA